MKINYSNLTKIGGGSIDGITYDNGILTIQPDPTTRKVGLKVGKALAITNSTDSVYDTGGNLYLYGVGKQFINGISYPENPIENGIFIMDGNRVIGIKPNTSVENGELVLDVQSLEENV